MNNANWHLAGRRPRRPRDRAKTCGCERTFDACNRARGRRCPCRCHDRERQIELPLGDEPDGP